MERKYFNKLVRDKIPDILDKNGGDTEIEILNDENYIKHIYKKLKEECEEVVTANSQENLIEELADLEEVISSIAKLHQINRNEIETVRIAKKEKRGGFENKILLKSAKIVNDF